jgi:hypothetical protein
VHCFLFLNVKSNIFSPPHINIKQVLLFLLHDVARGRRSWFAVRMKEERKKGIWNSLSTLISSIDSIINGFFRLVTLLAYPAFVYVGVGVVGGGSNVMIDNNSSVDDVKQWLITFAKQISYD